MKKQSIKILGINAYHPDASVALLVDGVPVWAAEEERFSRLKHASGFPAMALRRCLEENRVDPGEIAYVAISKNPRANLLRKIGFVLAHRPDSELVANRVRALYKAVSFRKDFEEALRPLRGPTDAKFVRIEHHRCHAASSVLYSGFDRCAFLSIDGLGDFSSALWGRYDGRKLHLIQRVYFPHSAGFFYTAGTQFLGFHHFGDEYKVMGLAAYGKPIFRSALRRMIELEPDGSFKLNLHYFRHHLGSAKVRWEGGVPEQDILYSELWEDFFGSPRNPEAPITERERNLAASLQAVLEEIVFHVLGHLQRKTRESHLCLSGGVGFNCAANGKISRMTGFKNIYIPPASGDAGTSLGAAAYVWHFMLNNPPRDIMDHAYLGSSSREEDIEGILRQKGLAYIACPEDDLLEKTARAISEGKVVGWFQGRMEFGPRALGNRSILADPRHPGMKDILNQRIKHRETFRPFAPAVPVEKAHDYFEMDCEHSPFMLKVFPVKPGKKEILPAITHEDGTARVQTVSKEQNEIFWKLLMRFGEITGVPVLLNTSFNENEPVVCRAGEAVDCFLKTKMDVLVLGHFYAEKT